MPTQIELGIPRKPDEPHEAKEDVKPFHLMEFIREVRTEFTKISWPSKDQTIREFISVIILVAILSGIIFLIDKIFGAVSNFFKGGFY